MVKDGILQVAKSLLNFIGSTGLTWQKAGALDGAEMSRLRQTQAEYRCPDEPPRLCK